MSTQADTETQERGNIVTLSNPPRTVRSRGWFLTQNNYTDEHITLLTQYITKYAIKGMFQEEKGKEGTPHLQGFFILKNATSNTTLYKRFPTMYIRPLKSEEGAAAYCQKDETYTGGIRMVHGYTVVDDPIKEPSAWQRKILRKIQEEPNPREITWVVDLDGNQGKTSLAKHICLKNDDAIYVGGKAADVKYAIAQMIEKGKPPRIVLFDFPRSCKDYISYQGIEEVKNGIFFSGKYEAGMVMFNTPHVICFANQAPEYEKMSLDRWNIVFLGDAKVVSTTDAMTDAITDAMTSATTNATTDESFANIIIDDL